MNAPEPRESTESSAKPVDPPKPPDAPLTAPASVTAAHDSVPASAPKKPSPEEQLAAFEEQLKEDDWGHQPC
jgi:hypothetical protein